MKIFKRIEISCSPKFSEVVVSHCHDFATIGIEEEEISKKQLRIVAYFDHQVSLPRLKKIIEKGAPPSTLVTYSIIEDEDWLRFFRQTQVPIQVGNAFLITPVDGIERTGRHTINIPIERAFGTGSHASTRHCLEAVESFVGAGMTVLDVGTGSGILAIAAAKCGARRVDAVENDPDAVDIAKKNISSNGVERIVRAIHGDLAAVTGRIYEMVLANISSEIILAHMQALSEKCADGGRLVLAGILAGRQEAQVTGALKRHHFSIVKRRHEGEWVTFTAERDKK